MNTIKTEITEDRQDYLDRPILKTVPVFCGTEPMTGLITDGYERSHLNWKKPVFDSAGDFLRLQ